METAGATGAAATGHLFIAGGGVYCASKELVEGCRKYNEAVDLENHVNDLERFAYEEGVLDEYQSDKQWWQFWR